MFQNQFSVPTKKHVLFAVAIFPKPAGFVEKMAVLEILTGTSIFLLFTRILILSNLSSCSFIPSMFYCRSLQCLKEKIH
jgi:hypothetical protein